MTDDTQWPGQQPGDALTYVVVSHILAGDDPQYYAAFQPDSYGRWHALVYELFDAHRESGCAGLLQRYLQIVYRDPGFALLMASHGMHGPTEPWRPDQRPGRAHLLPAATYVPPTPPAVPGSKPSQDWSVWDLLAGCDEPAPVKRHAVREEQVYAALCELGEATVAELARHTVQDRGNVHRRVQKLLEAGKIERYVTPKAIVYRVHPAP